MAASLSCIDLTLQGMTTGLSLELSPGTTALFTTPGEQETALLARTFAGEHRPDDGRVLLDGSCLAELPRGQLHHLRRAVGIVSPQGGLISNLKLWENITLPLLFHDGEVPESAGRTIRSLLDGFGFTGNIWALPGHLTPFERRMASFIRAAVSGARYMIYAGCFDNLPHRELDLLLEQTVRLQRSSPGMTSLYLTTGAGTLDRLEPDLHCNLRHHPALITRNA